MGNGGRRKQEVTRDSCFVLAALCLLLWADAAIAHQAGTTGYADISVSGQMVRYSLTLSDIPMPSPLAEEMGFGQPGIAPDYRPLVNAIAGKIHFTSGGEACAAGPGQVVPPTSTTIRVTAIVDFVCPGEVRELGIRDDLFDAAGPNLHTLAKIEWPGGVQQFAFATESRETKVMVGEKVDAARGAGSFFPMGIEHILTGYDHLLFLLALMLRGGGLWSLLKIITAFTIAHSITLALAALDLVVLPGAVVESVIALSIAYVALENLLPRYAVSRRWAVSFLFGLVHGFGFSSVLREIGLPKENLLLSLLNFNLGVEVGQLTVVLLVVPILMRLKSKPWEPRIVATISGVILAVGLVLFVDRAFLTTSP
jgi:hydrogenase/urease accessory protein HupE